MSQNPVALVVGPPPVRPRYNLIDTALRDTAPALSLVRDPDDHWMLGAKVWLYSADLPEGWDPCSAGTFRVKPDGSGVTNPEFGAFMAVVGETCSAFSMHDQAEFEERAFAIYDARESFAVERELASGNALSDAFPYLGENPDLLNGATAVGSKAALSLLENAIGATGSGGIIWATPGIVSAWGEFQVHDEGGSLVTTTGTPVIVADGMIGVLPENAPGALDPGQEWAFASGPVDVRRGERMLLPGSLKEAMDREVNEITYRVERPYLLTWDPSFTAAVLVDWSS